jgi:hypothetical protein
MTTTPHHRRPLFLIGLALVAGLAGCTSTSVEGGSLQEPATVEAVDGSDLNRVTLTAQAAERIGLRTAVASPTTVPFSAILYDANGRAWVYTEVGEHVYLRVAATVKRVDDGVAYLEKNPAWASGTTVVTVGVPELYGVEYGVGGE